MEIYTLLRAFADSWALLALTVFFVGVFVWAFRPGSRLIHQETANMIFRDDEKPLPQKPLPQKPKSQKPMPQKEA